MTFFGGEKTRFYMNREQPEVTKQVYPLTVGKLFLSIYMKNLLSCDFFFFKENRNIFRFPD
jgi:hypothetical protein